MRISHGGYAPHGRGESMDHHSRVREKVLFLLDPERWLGIHKDYGTRGTVSGGELKNGGETEHELHCPLPGSERDPTPESSLEGPSGTEARNLPPKHPRSVLVKVLDYQVKQEILQTAWLKGQMTLKTEERSMTSVSFWTYGGQSEFPETVWK
ncbi:uncharacterized protein C6orf141 homolog [Trichosurus vulpecula]|uniref:uncharacterized protein C6orf141 homolog n=1 Tax=Trichosurus vulpecula TaxID=9337 RepID=UPI00186AD83D|nr:uncharacterized protein C6orf141 homolog [Trichosurus vulpecula]